MPMANVMADATHHGRNATRTRTISADVSMCKRPLPLVKRRVTFFIPEVIENPAYTGEDETLKDEDYARTNNHPLGDFGEERAFDDMTEGESDDGNDDCRDDRSPNCESFDKCNFVHDTKKLYLLI